MAIPFALVGTTLVPQQVFTFMLGIPLALIASAGQFIIGSHVPKQSVILSFLLDSILVIVFTYVV